MFAPPAGGWGAKGATATACSSESWGELPHSLMLDKSGSFGHRAQASAGLDERLVELGREEEMKGPFRLSSRAGHSLQQTSTLGEERTQNSNGRGITKVVTRHLTDRNGIADNKALNPKPGRSRKSGRRSVKLWPADRCQSLLLPPAAHPDVIPGERADPEQAKGQAAQRSAG